MASISSFPYTINQRRVQIFRCTRVFNHLLLAGHERQACQSNPSSTRRLNRGSCHTPKFALLLFKTFHTSILKDSSRVDQTSPLLSNQPQTKAWLSSDQDGFPTSPVIIMPHHML